MEPTKETALRKHLSTLTITTIVLLLVFSAVFYFFPQWYFKAFPVLFLSEVIVFFVVDYLFINNVTNKGKNFIVQHKLATTIKFFVLLMVLSTFLLFNKQDSIKIAVVFISLFCCFSCCTNNKFFKNF